MPDAPGGTWFPRAVGLVALLLAAGAALDFLFVPAGRSQQVLFGYLFEGRLAQLVTAIHVFFFSWTAWAAFARHRYVPIIVIGYSLYLIEALWVWTALFGGALYEKTPRGVVLLNGLITAMLLAFCRYVWKTRPAFDRNPA